MPVKKKTSENSPLDNLVEETSVQAGIIEEIEKTPKPFTSEWDAYVMGQFSADELEDGKPKVAGLRRVTQKLVGPIYQSNVTIYQCPNQGTDNRAVVAYSLTLQVLNANHPLYGNEISLSDAADVGRDNTNDPYVRHSVGTATTRAEARILRKILGIKAIAAEESFDRGAVSYQEEAVINFEGKASDAQLQVMDYIMRRQGTNPVAFLAEFKTGKTKHTLTEEDAEQLMAKLNEFNKDGVPSTMSGYKEW